MFRRLGHLLAFLALVPLAGCATTGSPPPRTAAALPPPAALSFTSARETAVACARRARFDLVAFASCTQHQLILTADQQAVLDCAASASESEHFAACAAPHLGITLSRPQLVTADCAMHSGGFYSRFASCAGTEARGGRATPREAALLACARKAEDQGTKFSACSARWIVGDDASRGQRIALDCAAQTGANTAAFTTCAGASLFNVKLSDDGTIAVECVLLSGGVPFAAVGCIATRYVTRELNSCAAKGFGGAHGCFGDDNALIGRNGWTRRSLREIAADPHSVVHDPGQWWAETAMHARMAAMWKGSGKVVQDTAAFWREHAAALRARWRGERPPGTTTACNLWC